MKVHTSNFKVVGFTEEVPMSELAELGARRGVPTAFDLGSGRVEFEGAAPLDGVGGETLVRQAVESGLDVVGFSGDKLLGGPQAGIIAGRADLVAQCARHPLARAFRPGGLVLAALQELAMAYLHRDGDAIPFWRMAALTPESLRARAEALGAGEVTDLMSVPGGGTLPTVEIPSAGIRLSGDRSAALRAHTPPIIARVNEHQTLLDLRTVDPAHDPVVAEALRAITAT